MSFQKRRQSQRVRPITLHEDRLCDSYNSVKHEERLTGNIRQHTWQHAALLTHDDDFRQDPSKAGQRATTLDILRATPRSPIWVSCYN